MQTYWGFNGGILAAVSGVVFYLLALLVFVLVYGRNPPEVMPERYRNVHIPRRPDKPEGD
jgi:hypothetical protein